MEQSSAAAPSDDPLEAALQTANGSAIHRQVPFRTKTEATPRLAESLLPSST